MSLKPVGVKKKELLGVLQSYSTLSDSCPLCCTSISTTGMNNMVSISRKVFSISENRKWRHLPVAVLGTTFLLI